MKRQIQTQTGGRQQFWPWTPNTALQLAWTTWVVLLVTPFMMLPLTLHLMPSASGAGPKPELAGRWYGILMVYLLVAIPVALVIRAVMFKGLWHGQPVPPQRYYSGMLLLWFVVVAGGITAELVCVATATLVPNILPAMLALIVFLSLWPTGRPMEHCRTGDAARSEVRQ